MTNKPTYKELGQRVRKLTDEDLDRDQMEKDVERIFNFSIDMIGSGNLKGYFTRINSSFKKTLGYTQREILENPFIKFVHDDDVEKTKKALADAVKGKKEIYIVNRYKCKDDSYKWIEWKVSVIVKENKFIAVGRDITERKQSEEALLKSEEKYRRLFESLVDVFYQADSSGKITMVSPSITKAAGYKPEEVIGSYLNDYYVNPDERNKFLELISTNGFVEKFEVQMKKKDGSVLWASVNASLSKDQEGNVVGVEGIARDITERIKGEEVLRESKERFRSLTEVTSDWIWEVDKNAYYTYASPKINDLLGYDPEEIIGKTPFDLMPAKEAKRVSKIFNNIAASQQPFDCLENVNFHKNGQPVVIETSGTPIFNADGEFLGYRGIDRDITNRKQTEEALRKSEERYRSLAENSRVGIWQTTLDGYIIYMNPAMRQMLEIENPEELHGETYGSFFDERNRKIIERNLAKRIRGISSTYEVELIGKKGTKRNVMISGSPIFFSENKIHSSISTFTDITDKKRAERALMKARNELEQRVKKRTRELEIKTQNLEETNIAMKVLLKKREEDRKDIEYNVLTNVRKLIAPYFDRIRKTKLKSQQNAFLNIIESNLQEITSQFARKISMKELNLTPTEIHVANMIRHGNSSKEIAGIMNVSKCTVAAHRRNIRKKIGLVQKRVNLRSYLLSLH
jgi:PAS domain S-box-containing protein